MLYSHIIHICLLKHNDAMKTSGHRSLENIYLSLYLKGFERVTKGLTVRRSWRSNQTATTERSHTSKRSVLGKTAPGGKALIPEFCGDFYHNYSQIHSDRVCLYLLGPFFGSNRPFLELIVLEILWKLFVLLVAWSFFFTKCHYN